MFRKLSKLRPVKWLCPFCNEWHEWTGERLSAVNNLVCPRNKEISVRVNIAKDTRKNQLYLSYIAGKKDVVCNYSGAIFNRVIDPHDFKFVNQDDDSVNMYFKALVSMKELPKGVCDKCSRHCNIIFNDFIGSHTNVRCGIQFNRRDFS
ncbi:MAG: hypothetical protein IJS47_00320 [Clostridia bacterium]|nr:hypothetical protein [Clostridia bacterium]